MHKRMQKSYLRCYNVYLKLVLLGILWIGFSWEVSSDSINFHGESKYNDIKKKFFPITVMGMILFGCMFFHHLTHIGELT